MPTTIIASYLKGETADKIVQIQDELIKHGVDSSLRTKRDDLHITYVAIFDIDGIQNIFDNTFKCLEGVHKLNF